MTVAKHFSARYEAGWKNVGSDTCPPHGIAEVTGDDGSERPVVLGKKCVDPDKPFLINGSSAVPPGGHGTIASREPFAVLTTDSVNVGDSIGLVVGQWEAGSAGSGIEVWGTLAHGSVLGIREKGGGGVGFKQAIVKAAVIFDETTLMVQLTPGDINIHGRFSVVTEAQIKADHPQMLLEARNLWGLQGEINDQLLVTRQRRQMTMPPLGEVPTGACVMTDGSCQVMTSSQCAAAGGTYQGDNTTCSMESEWEWVIDFAMLKRFDPTTDQQVTNTQLQSKRPPFSGWSKQPNPPFVPWHTGAPCP